MCDGDSDDDDGGGDDSDDDEDEDNESDEGGGRDGDSEGGDDGGGDDSDDDVEDEDDESDGGGRDDDSKGGDDDEDDVDSDGEDGDSDDGASPRVRPMKQGRDAPFPVVLPPIVGAWYNARRIVERWHVIVRVWWHPGDSAKKDPARLLPLTLLQGGAYQLSPPISADRHLCWARAWAGECKPRSRKRSD